MPKKKPNTVSTLDVVTRAAWLYYVGGCTQEEIAHKIGVSRPSVIKYLANARQRNLVTTRLDPNILHQFSIAETLVKKYAIKQCYIAPIITQDVTDSTLRRQQLGVAGAQALSAMLKPDTILGVAWGRTLLSIANALPKRQYGNMQVLQISGSALGDDATMPEACTLQIAFQLGAQGKNLHAPANVSSIELCSLLKREPSLQRHFTRLQSCSIVVFGVGELHTHTVWPSYDQAMQDTASTYIELGAKGVLIGRFIDKDGQEVKGPLSGHQIGMELADLLTIKTRLCVSGGNEKIPAMHAALTGGYISHLVTDIETAETLANLEK